MPSVPDNGFIPCPEVPPGGCSVCGEGKCVTSPESEVDIGGTGVSSTCADIESAGLSGELTSIECAQIERFLEACECDTRIPSEDGSQNPSAEIMPSFLPSLQPSVINSDTPTVSDNGSIPCPEVPPGGCSVCGEGKCVTSPESEVDIGGTGVSSTCADIESAGLSGELTSIECAQIERFLEACECDTRIPSEDGSQNPSSEIMSSFLPSLQPSVISSDTPTVSDNGFIPCPEVPPGGCSVCGEGKCVTSPESEVDIGGTGVSSTCADIQTGGLEGLFSQDECNALESLVSQSCACDNGILVGDPTPSSVITFLPTSNVPVFIFPLPPTPPPIEPTPSPGTPTTKPVFIFPLPPSPPPTAFNQPTFTPVSPTARPVIVLPLPTSAPNEPSISPLPPSLVPTQSPVLPTARPVFIIPLPTSTPNELSTSPVMPSSVPTQDGGNDGLVKIPAYEYDRGNCPNAGSTGLQCAPKNLHVICSKSGGLFSDCLKACEPSFCCIHDSPKATNLISPTCNTDENCAQYAPCYIVWWKIHDTVGPAPFINLKQSDDFYETESLQDVTTNHEFFTQWLYHHWEDISVLFQDLNNDPVGVGELFSSSAVWDSDVNSD